MIGLAVDALIAIVVTVDRFLCAVEKTRASGHPPTDVGAPPAGDRAQPCEALAHGPGGHPHWVFPMHE